MILKNVKVWYAVLNNVKKKKNSDMNTCSLIDLKQTNQTHKQGIIHFIYTFTPKWILIHDY